MTIDVGFLPGQPNRTGDFYAEASGGADGTFDVLIFTDSRGYSLERPAVSWAAQVFRSLADAGRSVMVVVRPRNLTGLLTLHNFLVSCPWTFTNAVCQVGIVDFMPKTEELLEEMTAQRNVHLGALAVAVRPLDRAPVTLRPGPGETATLAYEQTYALELDAPALTAVFVSMLERHFRYTLLVGSVESDETAHFTRVRPKSFFDQVARSNRFLRDLGDRSDAIHYLEPLKRRIQDTPILLKDGVHYAEGMHGHVSQVVQAVLAANLASPEASVAG